MRVLRWIAERLKDLLYDPTNNHLDAGRVSAWLGIAVVFVSAFHNVRLKEPLDLGPTGLPGGLTALFGALQFYLYHDRKGQ